MAERQLPGSPASPGVAIGPAWLRIEQVVNGQLVALGDREQERERALEALAAAADALRQLAERLGDEEAAIVEAGALMALDPALKRDVEAAIISDGLAAGPAILRATTRHADAVAAVGDELLAARADDVRSLGRRAARLTTDRGALQPPGTDLILVAQDVGPGDVAELAPVLAGVALAGGGVTAHAAIVARSLGVPMVTGLGQQLLALSDGVRLAVDGTAGSVVVDPSSERAAASIEQMRARRHAAQRAQAEQGRPAITTDGRRITVLANVASRAELDLALSAGAEGIGLLRTELAFLDATDWPCEQGHTDALKPILEGLGSRRAIVRVLDFGADKSPPFLNGVAERGLELLLRHRDAFLSQLRAILLGARGRELAVLLPMVADDEQVAQSRELLERAARELGVTKLPALGSMIETPLAAANAPAIAALSDFLSIGTNDLTAATLGADRFSTNAARAYDPQVLRPIARSVEAAHRAGISIEVCGEAASDPLMLPLLVGLGVDLLSVGAAQVGVARRWIWRLSAEDAGTLARSALEMNSAEEVEQSVRPLAGKLQSSEPGELVPALGA
jgi:phosphoenolpyruvate-protein phosphotransferase